MQPEVCFCTVIHHTIHKWNCPIISVHHTTQLTSTDVTVPNQVWCALIGKYLSHGQPDVLHHSSMVEKLLTLWDMCMSKVEEEKWVHSNASYIIYVDQKLVGFYYTYSSKTVTGCIQLASNTKSACMHSHTVIKPSPTLSHLSLYGVTPLPGHTIVQREGGVLAILSIAFNNYLSLMHSPLEL